MSSIYPVYSGIDEDPTAKVVIELAGFVPVRTPDDTLE